MRWVSRWPKWAEDRGAAALEFAILAPLLLVLIAGIVEFGRMYQAQLAVTSAAREGARSLAVDKWNEPLVRSAAYPYGNKVTITRSVNSDSVDVSVKYQWAWSPSFPIGRLPLGGPPLLEGRATMRKE